MNRQMFGDPAVFAIEFRPRELRMLYAGAAVWFGNVWIGDADEPELLGSMAERMNKLRGERRSRSRLMFDTANQVDEDELLDAGAWSFGPSFDDYRYIFYGLRDARTVNWLWRAHPEAIERHPAYPPGWHRSSVSFETYDRVVGQFLNALGVPDDVEPGVPWAYDPRC
jgi:hypothetical protein